MSRPNPTGHPARFSDEIVDEFRKILQDAYPEWFGRPMLFDPFAGTGEALAELAALIDFPYGGVELQPEWIAADNIVCGDATDLKVYPPPPFVIVTSPCPTPGMRVLTADLRWVPAGDLRVGDRLMAFNENPPGRKSNGWNERRRFEWAEVTHSAPARKRCVRVVLESGDEITVSHDHPWLGCRSKGYDRQEWIASDRLHPGSIVLRQFDTWTAPPNTWQAGWLAGFLDGEGWVSYGVDGAPKLGWTQVHGTTQDRAAKFAADLGFQFAEYGRSPIDGRRDIVDAVLLGGWPEITRALGQIRPGRLLEKYMAGDLSSRTLQAQRVVVEAVEGVGERDIQEISTTSGTLIVEGYLQHNTYPNGMADSWLATDDSRRNTYQWRLDRLVGKHVEMHPNNQAQFGYRGTKRGGKSKRRENYWRVADLAVNNWRLADMVLLNVSDFRHSNGQTEPLVTDWRCLLKEYGWTDLHEIPINTRRNRDGANADQRVEHEVIVVAKR